MRVGVGALICTVLVFGCKAGDSGTIKTCQPGAVSVCSCGTATAMSMCLSDGSGFAPCPCASGVAGTAGASVPITMSGSGGMMAVQPPGTSGMPAIGASGKPGSGGTPAVGASGRPGSGGMSATMSMAGKPGSGGASAGTTGGAAGAAGNQSGVSDADLATLRQTCVDEINMYRAMVSGLMPLTRGNATQEACSDTGCAYDGTNNAAHGYARMPYTQTCRGTARLQSEDTCPGWPIGGFSGNATIADALKSCLKSMWAEGDPSQGRAACIQDQSATGCFEMHGHYLNMSDPMAKTVSCSFFKMSSGAYWMNQDFGY